MVTTCFTRQISRTDGRGVGGTRSLFAAVLALSLFAGCSRGGYTGGRSDAAVRDAYGAPEDALIPDLVAVNLDGSVDLRAPADFAAPSDLGARPDLGAPPDLAARPDLGAPPDMTAGSITGGPCLSGASGATAFRVRWSDGGGRATVNYEVHGLPDKSRWKVGVYGYGIGFTPQFVDRPLGGGGLQLDGSSFIDVELSTAGVHSITSVSLAVFGRSYSIGSSGSFNWMTFTDFGSTATNYVSNAAPYSWYPGDATSAIPPDDNSILIRIKAGGSSGALVVNRLELCINAS